MSAPLQRKSLNLPQTIVDMVDEVVSARGVNFTDAVVKLIERGYVLHRAVEDKKKVEIGGAEVILL